MSAYLKLNLKLDISLSNCICSFKLQQLIMVILTFTSYLISVNDIIKQLIITFKNLKKKILIKLKIITLHPEFTYSAKLTNTR